MKYDNDYNYSNCFNNFMSLLVGHTLNFQESLAVPFFVQFSELKEMGHWHRSER